MMKKKGEQIKGKYVLCDFFPRKKMFGDLDLN